MKIVIIYILITIMGVIMGNKSQLLKDSTKLGIALIVSGFLTASTIFLISDHCQTLKEQDEHETNLNNYVYHLLSTDSFAEYRDTQAKILTEKYRNGKISAKEFAEQLSMLTTVHHILDNKDTVLTQDQKDHLDVLEQNVRDCENEAALKGMLGLSGVMGTSFGLVAVNYYKNKKRKEEREKLISREL